MVRPRAVVLVADADHDVLGLQIAMHDAELVRDRDGGERLHEEVDDALVGERPLVAEDGEQVATVEELHREVDEAVRLDAEVDARAPSSGDRGGSRPSPRDRSAP